MKPCEIPCDKCGSTSVKRNYLKKGQPFRLDTYNYNDVVIHLPALVPTKSRAPWEIHFNGLNANYDVIINKCIVCSHMWESLPLS